MEKMSFEVSICFVFEQGKWNNFIFQLGRYLMFYHFNFIFFLFTQTFNNMILLTLDSCKYLINIPNVSGLQHLRKLSFKECDNLIKIHKSIGHLSKLEILDAYGCKKLESFPSLRLSFLEKLELSMCTSLKNFPKLLCEMKNIIQINLYKTSIRKLPSSFKNLSELRQLYIYMNVKSSNVPVKFLWCQTWWGSELWVVVYY
jgi:hypothetical protein